MTVAPGLISAPVIRCAIPVQLPDIRRRATAFRSAVLLCAPAVALAFVTKRYRLPTMVLTNNTAVYQPDQPHSQPTRHNTAGVFATDNYGKLVINLPSSL